MLETMNRRTGWADGRAPRRLSGLSAEAIAVMVAAVVLLGLVF